MRPERFRCALTLLALALCSSAALAQNEPADPATRAYLSANGMLARGMNELAAEEYRRFLSEQPGHERALHARYGLAMALYRLGEYAEALPHLDGLAEQKGFEFAAESAFLHAQCELAAGNPKGAAGPLSLLVRRHTSHDLADDAGALLTEANYRGEDHKAAVAAAEALAKAAPESPLRDRAEYFAALSELKLGNERAAADRLTGLAERWPASPLAGQSLLLGAQCAHRAGEVALAQRSYEALLARPDGALVPEALLGLAALEHAAQKPDLARRHLDRLIRDHSTSPQAMEAHLNRAKVLFDQSEFDAARADLAQYAKHPKADQAQATYWTAKCHLRTGKAASAAELLAAALDALPAAHALRPSMMYDLAVASLEAGRHDDAAAALQRFGKDYRDHPFAPDAAEALATLLHRQGEYAASTRACEDFIAHHPDHAGRARIELLAAENAMLAGDLPAAERAYQDYLAAHPSTPGAPLAKFRLGCLYLRQDQHRKAEKLLAQSATLAADDPFYRPAILYLGDIAFQAGRWAEAEASLAQFASFGIDAPGSDEALMKRGIALFHLGRHDECAEILGRLILEHPRSAHRNMASLERARALIALDRDDEAEQLLRTLARSDDTQIAALSNIQLASLAVARGDLNAAAAFFGAGADTGDGRAGAEALHGLASVHLSAGDHPSAITAFDRLLAEHPDHPRREEARAQRALARARHQATDEAVAELAASIRNAPDLAPELRDALQLELATCLSKLERPADARKQLASLISSASTPTIRVHAALDLARAELNADEPAKAAQTLRSITSLLDRPGIDGTLREHIQYQLAAAEFRQEHFKPAGDLLAAFLDAHPKSTLAPSAALLAAECLIRQNQHARAIEPLKLALAAELPDTDRQSALLRLGECCAQSQDWRASEQAFTTFLEQFSSSDLWFQGCFGKGWALEHQGKHEQAMAEYANITAAHQGPTAARAQFQIGECLFAMSRHKEAIREFLKVDILYAYPEWSAAALYEAGRCFEALGQHTEARAQYQQLREKHAESHWASLAGKRLAAITTTPEPNP